MFDILFSKRSQRSKTMVDAENDEFKTPLHLATETGNVSNNQTANKWMCTQKLLLELRPFLSTPVCVQCSI